MTQLLDKKSTAALLGVSVRTVDGLRKKGLPFSLIGGQVRFDERELEAWIKAQQPAPAETQDGRDK